METFRLANRVAVVTGGTKGIGFAVVELFLKLGATVLFTGRSETEVASLEQNWRKQYKNVYGFVAEVTDIETFSDLQQFSRETFGRIDILVNNAGTNLRKATTAYTAQELEALLNVNLKAPFLVSQFFYSLLQQSAAGAIINVGSVAGQLDVRTGSPYGMAKGGLLQLSRNLAVEWASAGIRVNTVSPWFTETPLTAGLLADSEKLEAVLARTPLRRVAKPIEIAAAVAFFAMPEASFITGQNLVIDGGMSANAL